MSSFSCLNQLTKRSTFFRRNAADQFLRCSERTLLAEMTRTQLSQRALFGDSLLRDSSPLRRRWITSKAGKAFELLLERFACCFNLLVMVVEVCLRQYSRSF